MRKPRTALMTVAAVAATATLSLSGVALAATGTLPGAADDEATTKVPASVELTIPGPAEASNGHSNDRGRSAAQTGDEADATGTSDEETAAAAEETGTGDEAAPTATPQPRPTDTHGYEVSQLATTTELTGRDKGAAISELARTRAADDERTDDADDEAPATTKRSATGEQARAEHAGADAR